MSTKFAWHQEPELDIKDDTVFDVKLRSLKIRKSSWILWAVLDIKQNQLSWPIIKSITTPKVLNSIFNLGKRGYCSQMNEYSKPHSNFMGGLQCTRLFLNSSILVYVHSLFFMKKRATITWKNFSKAKKDEQFLLQG